MLSKPKCNHSYRSDSSLSQVTGFCKNCIPFIPLSKALVHPIVKCDKIGAILESAQLSRCHYHSRQRHGLLECSAEAGQGSFQPNPSALYQSKTSELLLWSKGVFQGDTFIIVIGAGIWRGLVYFRPSSTPISAHFFRQYRLCSGCSKPILLFDWYPGQNGWKGCRGSLLTLPYPFLHKNCSILAPRHQLLPSLLLNECLQFSPNW